MLLQRLLGRLKAILAQYNVSEHKITHYFYCKNTPKAAISNTHIRKELTIPKYPNVQVRPFADIILIVEFHQTKNLHKTITII